MKLAVIGGASSYTPELVEGLFQRLDTIPVTELFLMDLNRERLAVIAGLSRRMAAKQRARLAVHETCDLREAVRGARYVVTQLRVGQIQARIADERLGLRHNIIGQETTGVGGFACALRTIPRILDIAHAMEDLAPEGVLVNFTNPSGIVTEALIKHSKIKSVGLCNVPIGIVMDIVKFLGCAKEDVGLDYVGLNHLSWIRRVVVAGEDVSAKVLAAYIEHAGEEWEVPAVRENMELAMRTLGMMLNGYLQYFYATDAVLNHLKNKLTTRGEDIIPIEQTLFEKYARQDLDEKPEELSKRGGAHYSTAAFNLIGAIEKDARNRQIVCCRNDGAIPTFDENVSVEVPAIIGKEGAAAIPQPAPAPIIRGLMQAVKAYESLTVKAAVTGDRDVAFEAMLAHPLMPGAVGSKTLLDELLEINRPYLEGTFF